MPTDAREPEGGRRIEGEGAPRSSRRWEAPLPRVVGHRGSPREATENTIASFEAARRAGARAVELDARMAADGAVVVHHDAELGRSIPGEGRIAAIASPALVEKGIPLLRAVLAIPDLLVNVEMKSDDEDARDLPRKVLDVVRAQRAEERVLVTSFDHELADQYARLSGLPAGMIVPYPPEDELASFPRLRFVALAADAALPEAIEACARADREVLVWTVNDDATARAVLAAGAAALITDRPGHFVRALGEGATAR